MTMDYNLSSHYTSNTRVERPKSVVVFAPDKLPVQHLYSDKDATNRMKSINSDIYQGFKDEKQKDCKNFTKIFVLALLGILAFLGIKKVFK